MRKKTPDPIVYYIKRFLTVVALPYFMYTNYQLYNVYKVVQQRKLEDKEKELENSQNEKQGGGNGENKGTEKLQSSNSQPAGKISSAAENIRIRVSQLEEGSKSIPAATKQ
ncbi:uncharacterized protein LOC144621726 [Crassostrea virginica]